jgi:hypothetical protein
MNTNNQDFLRSNPIAGRSGGFSGMLLVVATLASVFYIRTFPAFARQWVSVSYNPNILIDVDSIKGSGYTRTFWSKTEYYEDRSLGFNRYRSTTSLSYVNCRNETLGFIRTVFYDRDGQVVDELDLSNTPPELLAKGVVPDSVGEQIFRYVCSLRGWGDDRSYPAGSDYNQPTQPRISRVEALNLIQNWLEAKQEIFAPPYNVSTARRLTTGTFQAELVNYNGPINWLRDNNAWYRYRNQTIDEVQMFATSQDGKAVIQVKISEDVSYYSENQVVPSQSGLKTTTVRYTLERINGVWKISGVAEV